jgi:hypothetical protein
MKIDKAFLRRLGIASVVLIAVGGIAFRRELGDAAVFAASGTGFIIALANVIVGYVALRHARGGDMRRFNVVLFGSMAVRIVAILVLLLLCVLVGHMHAVALVASLFAFYMVFLVIELHSLLTGAPKTPPPGTHNG